MRKGSKHFLWGHCELDLWPAKSNQSICVSPGEGSLGPRWDEASAARESTGSVRQVVSVSSWSSSSIFFFCGFKAFIPDPPTLRGLPALALFLPSLKASSCCSVVVCGTFTNSSGQAVSPGREAASVGSALIPSLWGERQASLGGSWTIHFNLTATSMVPNQAALSDWWICRGGVGSGEQRVKLTWRLKSHNLILVQFQS